jgi:branched-chain amino acid transport system permease protein
MDLIIQTLLSGIVLGASYGLVAVGLTFVYGIGKIVNFAHGEFAMVGAYVLALTLGLGVPWPIALALGVVGVCLLAWFLEVAIVAPRLYKAHEHASVIATFALSILLANGALLLFGSTPIRVDSPLSDSKVTILGASVDGQRALTALISVVVLIALATWLRKSRLGLQMQAVSQNPNGALYTGINVRRLRRIAFILGAGLAGLAGVLVAPSMTAYPTLGINLVVTGFTIVILGGLGSVYGASLAGLVIGILYSAISTYVSVQWTTAAGWALVIVVLLLRPQGLLGKKPVRA